MSALLFVGGLGAVTPETAAFLGHGVQIVRGMRILQSPYLQGFTLSC